VQLGVGGGRVRVHACARSIDLGDRNGCGEKFDGRGAAEETCNPSSTTTLKLKGTEVVAGFARLGRKISHPLFVDANV
jgi:hypothetical protein